MASGGNEPFLPFEIIINILKRLPVKSIVRFRCVCKDWKNLFKTPSFITEHLCHSDHDNPLLLLHEYNCYRGHTSLGLLNHKMETIEVLSIPSIDGFRYNWSIIGSCNGLLCVTINLYRNGFPRSLCLWNPMIREVREIPQTTNDYWGFCRFGFGFCSILNDYKIVKFYNQELRKKKEIDQDYDVAKQGHDGVEMYSLSTDSWKELEFGALQNIEVTFTTASTDGMMVWVGERDSFPVLVSFDMVTEAFTITPILSVDGGLPTNLGAYQGKFAIVFRSYGYNSTDIMVMEQVASESGRSLSCTEEYSIDTFSHAPDPVCIWGNEVVFLGIESETDESEGTPGYFLNLFNLTTKKWKEFRNFSSNHDCSAGFTYERSLVSVWNTQVE